MNVVIRSVEQDTESNSTSRRSIDKDPVDTVDSRVVDTVEEMVEETKSGSRTTRNTFDITYQEPLSEVELQATYGLDFHLLSDRVNYQSSLVHVRMSRAHQSAGRSHFVAEDMIRFVKDSSPYITYGVFQNHQLIVLCKYMVLLVLTCSICIVLRRDAIMG